MLRPLAGFWFLNADYRVCNSMHEECFRPLAGFWFLKLKILMVTEL